jgi:uroporphyrinogen-III synthase
MSFAGKRVLSFESRRSVETAELIRRNDGEPVVVQSMREVPLESNDDALLFGDALLRGEFDMAIFLTGAGTRQLMKVLATRHDPAATAEALRRITVVARGPKPTAVLREIGVPPQIIAPEPNTWREVVAAIEGRPETRIVIQEYGRPATELVETLRASGLQVSTVPVYSYELPEDLEPLRDAVMRLAQQGIEVTLFTTGQQVVHLMEIAREMGYQDRVVAGLRKSLLASIGPTTTETLAEYGLTPNLEASHPKLGLLVREAALKLADIP